MEFSVHKFRASKKLKQSELGEILGVKQSYVSDIEVGRKKMPQELIDKLAEKFGDMSEFYEAKSENEVSALSIALEIITKQIEIIKIGRAHV